jgi:hypothetical protein
VRGPGCRSPTQKNKINKSLQVIYAHGKKFKQKHKMKERVLAYISRKCFK